MNKKFNADLFLEILSKKDKKQLIKNMSSLVKPDVYFAYALAVGYGFKNKGSFYDLLNETYANDRDPTFLKDTLNNLDKSIIYKPIEEIKHADEDCEYFLDIGLLSSNKTDNIFLIYSYFTTSDSPFPEVIKTYKSNEKIEKKTIKGIILKRLKKEGKYLNSNIKKRLIKSYKI